MSKNFISNKDETARMFKSDFMESLSRVHPAVPLLVYIPVISFFLYRSIVLFQFSFITIFSLIVFGIIVWSLAEYTLHRFIFHYEPKSKFGEKIHFIFHGVHHDYPSDSRRLVMPPSVSLPLAALFYFLFKSILGNDLVSPFFIGFIIGYLFYDMTHYAVHHFAIKNKFFLLLKKHHMRHHFQDSEKGFGVSSPMWDEVMKTNFDKTKEDYKNLA
ncbi:MAG TPA: sterol desaturase family protein [Ignavibacteriaceae bacterium]|nr:sterol desaturase family protein [Ignavibacteriaceae bacterium]